MNFFWYDHTTDDCCPKLKGLKKFMQKFGNGEKCTSLPKERIKNAAYFVHAGSEMGLGREDFAKKADINKKRFVIFVSSEPYEIKNFDQPGVYAIRYPLNEVVNRLTKSTVEQFKKSCKDGSPDMRVFSLSLPTNLVAAYLLQLANEADRKMTFPDGLDRKAIEEFKQINNDEHFTLPCPSVINIEQGIAEINRLFTAVAKNFQ